MSVFFFPFERNLFDFFDIFSEKVFFLLRVLSFFCRNLCVFIEPSLSIQRRDPIHRSFWVFQINLFLLDGFFEDFNAIWVSKQIREEFFFMLIEAFFPIRALSSFLELLADFLFPGVVFIQFDHVFKLIDILFLVHNTVFYLIVAHFDLSINKIWHSFLFFKVIFQVLLVFLNLAIWRWGRGFFRAFGSQTFRLFQVFHFVSNL